VDKCRIESVRPFSARTTLLPSIACISVLNLVGSKQQPTEIYDPLKHKTLPYVTAKPDIAVRSLRKNKGPQSGELKFIIAATDGRE
jgi:hypothetical protein